MYTTNAFLHKYSWEQLLLVLVIDVLTTLAEVDSDATFNYSLQHTGPFKTKITKDA